MNMQKILLFIMMITILSSISYADKERGNYSYVKSGEYGQVYIKSVPSDEYGLAGKTYVYQVQDTNDKLLYTYDWYSPEIYIWAWAGGSPAYVVKFGPWHRGHTASDKDLAIAIYKNEQLIKEYSTLEIAKRNTDIRMSISHYLVFGKRLGFRRPNNDDIILFDVEAPDGTVLTFDMETGRILSNEEDQLEKQFERIKAKVTLIKFEWHRRNKDKIEDISNYAITEEDLREIDPLNYPEAPSGYKIIPNSMWKLVDILKITNE